MSRPGSWLRDNSLTLCFVALFLASLLGMALAGVAELNAELRADQLDPVSLPDYLSSSAFAVDMAENWQSEYLQFLTFILATVWLVQRGSPESKRPQDAGLQPDPDELLGAHATTASPYWARAGGWRTGVFSWSLTLLMGAVFLASWLAQAISGTVALNGERLRNLQDPISFGAYLLDPDFWSRTLQNWQSEFLAVASMVAFSVFLRQRGSAESKPVGAAHSETAEEHT